jgi:sulfate/thiosulfate transport system substrate-binding protein
MIVKQPLTRAIVRFCFGLALSLALVACTRSNDVANQVAQQPDVEVTLVGYAVPKPAHNRIIKKFTAKWQQEHHQKVTFRQTYGGSGSQTRAVLDGLPADIVHLALGGDVDKLVKASLVAKDWNQKLPNQGIVAQSVAAIVTRAGNPKQIKSFADLARPEIKWVTANPKTSGGARWNFLALWHSAKKSNQNDTQATEFVAKAFANVVVQPKDAREAMDAFIKQGQGDALLNYENEIFFAKERGQQLEYIVPTVNISIDTPVAIVDKNVDKHGNRKVVEAFAKYLFESEAQAEFERVGYRVYRSVGTTSNPQFPQIVGLGTIAEYGGWTKFQQKFFADGAIYDQIEAGKINK